MRKEYGASQGAARLNGLVKAAREVQREELMKKLPLNYSLRYLYANNILPTVRKYIQLDTMSDASTLEELGPETRGEIESLVANGFLVATESEFLQ